MITSQESRALEKEAEKKGTSVLELMENAGKEVARVLQEKQDLKNKRILIVCYHGNNGGDGFVAANYLADKAEVEVLFVGEEEKLTPLAEQNLRRIEKNTLIQFISLEFVDFHDYDIIIDAMLGTGTKGKLKYPLNTVVDHINGAKAYRLSVDIPTGLDPDKEEQAKSVSADCIVAFHDLKPALSKVKGKTVVVDIGM